MLVYPEFDPVILHIYGPLAIRWYGLMYLIGLGLAWVLLSMRIRRASHPIMSQKDLVDIIFYAAIWMIVGGRVGYMLFYNWQNFIENPLRLFMIWQGGMSFHGGLLGVLLVFWLYGKKINCSFLTVADFFAPIVPLGLGAGRLGNFINGELWGRVTDVPWAMVFPQAGFEPRHPSQLYEFLLEGVLLFFILWTISSKQRSTGVISAWFLLLYGIFRFFVESFREPDWQKGFLAFGWVTEGQLLSIPMVIIGVLLLIMVSYRSVR